MADDILKSYLVSIGFKVDEQDYKKFKDSQLETEKRTKDLSKAFSDFAKIGIGSAVALGGMVLKVSSSLEEIHFQAKRSGTSAQNLKSFGEAAENIGIKSETAMGMVEQLNAQILKSPGEGTFLSFLGLDAKEDKTKLMLDLIDRLGKIQNVNERNAYGEHFGLSAVDVNTLIQGREELKRTYEERLKANAAIDAQAAAAHKAETELRAMEAQFSAVANTLGTTFLPVVKDVAGVLEQVAKAIIEADHATQGWSSKLIAAGAALTTTAGIAKTLGLIGGSTGAGTAATIGGAPLLLAGGLGAIENFAISTAAYQNQTWADSTMGEVTASSKQEQALNVLYEKETGKKPSDDFIAYGKWKAGKRGIHASKFTHSSWSGFGSSSSGGDVKSLINKYANMYGIDPNLLQAQAWQESRFNPNALSPKGAMGVMQLMPKTAAGLGVNPLDTEQNIEGGSRMMAGLLKKYGGNTDLALAAYNAGGGAVDRAGGIPNIAETQNYVASIQKRMALNSGGGVKIDQRTEINVNGAPTPRATADLVAQQQDKVNARMARNFAGATQ
jgi:soluble lytic murein transglycosylase-like protein